ncbi:MAG: pitrilysin family protein [Gammaproteobacteria bacterium]
MRAIGLLLVWLAAPLAQAVPEIQHWSTGNGARVYFVPAPELPMVDIRITFDAGSVRDGEKGGLALLTNALLAEGAGEWDADAIAERFDDLGAVFGNDAGRESATVSLRSLSDEKVLGPALETVRTLLQKPLFRQADLERERNRLLVSLRAAKAQPDEIASKAFYRAIYGDHPYARPPEGDESSVQSIEREDLVRFHRRYYVARNAQLAIVGALTRKGAEAIAERLMAGLPQGERAAALPPVNELRGPREIRIPHPSQQTHILIGQPGMRRGDPDYFALYMANRIFGGGGLVSRLNDAVREKRGLSYSVYSDLAPMARRGPFVMGLQTRNDQTEEALRVMRETLNRYLAEGPTEEELAAAKKNIIGGFPLNIDNNRKIVGYLGMIGFYGLELDYLNRFPGRIEALDREQVHDAFRRRIDPGKMVTVIVGGGASP